MHLLLIRHAQTTWNAAGRVQGQANPPLSDEGRAQCQALGRRFEGHHLDALYTSDLERARLTAEAVAASSGVRPVAEPGLREVDLGRWEGMDRESMRRDFPDEYQAWIREPSWDLVPDGEGSHRFRARVIETFTRLVASHDDRATVAAVTHIGVIRLVLTAAAGLESLGLRWPWAIDNTAITTLRGPCDPSCWPTPALVVTAVNDASHLGSVVD